MDASEAVLILRALPPAPLLLGGAPVLAGTRVHAVLFTGLPLDGHLLAVHPELSECVLRLDDHSERYIPFSELRYLLLPMSAPTTAIHPEQGEIEYQLRFRDAQEQQGRALHVLRDGYGVHIFRRTHHQLVRVFIPQINLDDIQLGPPLGQLLHEAGLPTPILQHVLEQQAKTPPPTPRLGELVREQGLMSEQEVQQALAHKLSLPYIRLEHLDADPDALLCLPAEVARHYHLLPLMLHDNRLRVAIADPTNQEAVQLLSFVTGKAIELVVAPPSEIETAINRYYGALESERALDDLRDDSVNELDEHLERESERLSKQKPIVRLVQGIILDAIRRRASDIHLRPELEQFVLLYRIDGVLAEIRRFNKTLMRAIVNRIKILGRMDIAVRRLPQDGQIQIHDGNASVDLRISALPTVNGESLVIRILDRRSGLKPLNELGINQEDYQKIRTALQHNYGLLLVTGPTGSGKSTTLYSMLNEILHNPVNIITVEDPVEYRIAGIEQVQVNPAIGLTFSRILRNILRHDPNVILIGEVRDQETAHIAVESALTGHLVLSTLHTNSAVGSITRLLEMGIEPYLLQSTLLGALAQRLVRLNCPHCLEPEPVADYVLQNLGLGGEETFFRGKGCTQCEGRGYQGRVAVYEWLSINPELRHWITPNADGDILQQQAQANGMLPLGRHALQLARQRRISLAEAYRVSLE